eukprot:432401_1
MAIVIRSNEEGLADTKDVGPSHRVLLNGKLSDNHFDIIHGVYNIDQGAPLHFHKHDIETFYILKGEFKIECSSKYNNNKIETVIVKPGDYVICPTLTYRAFSALKDQSEMLIINGPSGVAEFVKDLWKSQFEKSGNLNYQTVESFKNKYGIIVENPPQSKL